MRWSPSRPFPPIGPHPRSDIDDFSPIEPRLPALGDLDWRTLLEIPPDPAHMFLPGLFLIRYSFRHCPFMGKAIHGGQKLIAGVIPMGYGFQPQAFRYIRKSITRRRIIQRSGIAEGPVKGAKNHGSDAERSVKVPPLVEIGYPFEDDLFLGIGLFRSTIPQQALSKRVKNPMTNILIG